MVIVISRIVWYVDPDEQSHHPNLCWPLLWPYLILVERPGRYKYCDSNCFHCLACWPITWLICALSRVQDNCLDGANNESTYVVLSIPLLGMSYFHKSEIGSKQFFCSPFLLTLNLSLRCQLYPPPQPNSHFGRSFGPFSRMKNSKAQERCNHSLMKNSKLKAQAFAVPRCKRKSIMSGGY